MWPSALRKSTITGAVNPVARTHYSFQSATEWTERVGRHLRRYDNAQRLHAWIRMRSALRDPRRETSSCSFPIRADASLGVSCTTVSTRSPGRMMGPLLLTSLLSRKTCKSGFAKPPPPLHTSARMSFSLAQPIGPRPEELAACCCSWRHAFAADRSAWRSQPGLSGWRSCRQRSAAKYAWLFDIDEHTQLLRVVAFRISFTVHATTRLRG